MKRACEACTKSKVKCIKEEGQDSCLLCSKRRCPCVFQPRRQRNRIPGDKETARRALQSRRKLRDSPQPVPLIETLEAPWIGPLSRDITDITDETSLNDLKGTSWLKIPVCDKDLSFFTEALFEGESAQQEFDDIFLDELAEDANMQYLDQLVAKTSNLYPLDQLFYDIKNNLTVH